MSDTTGSPGSIEIARPYELKSLDDYIYDMALNRTMGDLIRMRTTAPSARTAFVVSTMTNAVFDLDIGLISEIVKRIDGSAPQKGDMDAYSNLFSDALGDVLDYTQSDQMSVFPSDPPIIALAKATVAIALHDPGRNMQARKDRQKAVQMILDRVEGRRAEPAKPTELPEYRAADWLGLPGEGDDDEKERQGDADATEGRQGTE